MAAPARGDAESQAEPVPRRATLVLTFLFVLAAISVSAGLVIYTAWLHDLKDGPFAVLFAVLSAKAALSWLAWNEQDGGAHLRDVGDQPKQD